MVDPAKIPHAKDHDATELDVLLYEFKHGLNAYLGASPEGGAPRTLADLIVWNKNHAREEMPWFGQEILEQAEAKGPLSDEAYTNALEANLRLSRGEGLDAVWGRARCRAASPRSTGTPESPRGNRLGRAPSDCNATPRRW